MNRHIRTCLTVFCVLGCMVSTIILPGMSTADEIRVVVPKAPIKKRIGAEAKAYRADVMTVISAVEDWLIVRHGKSGKLGRIRREDVWFDERAQEAQVKRTFDTIEPFFVRLKPGREYEIAGEVEGGWRILVPLGKETFPVDVDAAKLELVVKTTEPAVVEQPLPVQETPPVPEVEASVEKHLPASEKIVQPPEVPAVAEAEPEESLGAGQETPPVPDAQSVGEKVSETASVQEPAFEKPDAEVSVEETGEEEAADLKEGDVPEDEEPKVAEEEREAVPAVAEDVSSDELSPEKEPDLIVESTPPDEALEEMGDAGIVITERDLALVPEGETSQRSGVDVQAVSQDAGEEDASGSAEKSGGGLLKKVFLWCVTAALGVVLIALACIGVVLFQGARRNRSAKEKDSEAGSDEVAAEKSEEKEAAPAASRGEDAGEGMADSGEESPAAKEAGAEEEKEAHREVPSVSSEQKAEPGSDEQQETPGVVLSPSDGIRSGRQDETLQPEADRIRGAGSSMVIEPPKKSKKTTSPRRGKKPKEEDKERGSSAEEPGHA